ncbi:MAG: MFS transporter, partial [Chloroflexota bacterium]
MRSPDPVTGPAGPDPSARYLRAGIVACLAYALVGWRGILVPSMIRSVEPFFGQDDAGIGLYFFATALAYGAGSLLGGRLIRRHGPRSVIPAAFGLMCAGLVLQGITGTWVVFAMLGVLVSLGASAADIGVNSLVLDLFPHASGRAMNLLHVAYGVGALVAPLALAGIVGAGIAWQVPMLVSGLVAGAVAVAMAISVPGGRFHVDEVVESEDGRAVRGPLPRFLFVMAIAAGCYVAAEAGVSDWLVRYLAVLPIGVASTALMLFWAGIAIGRIVFARIGARLDPLRSAALLGPVGGVILLVALVLPVSSLTPLLF